MVLRKMKSQLAAKRHEQQRGNDREWPGEALVIG
jgi:hypothetical protein